MAEMSMRLFPLCNREMVSSSMKFFSIQCLPCNVTNPYNEANAKDYALMARFGNCNPNISIYPQALYQCQLCNKSFINAIFACLIFTTVWVISVNAWSIAVWTSNKRFKKSQIYFKISLAASNFLFGVIVLPYVVFNMYNIMYTGHKELYDFATLLNRNETGSIQKYYDHWQVLFTAHPLQPIGVAFVALAGANVGSFLLMGIDRYLALSLSLRYHKIMTKRRSILVIILTWLVAVLFATLAMVAIRGGKITFRAEPGAMFLPIPIFSSQDDVQYLLVFAVPYIVVFITNICVIFATTKTLKTSQTANTSTFGFLKSMTSRSFSVFSQHSQNKVTRETNVNEVFHSDGSSSDRMKTDADKSMDYLSVTQTNNLTNSNTSINTVLSTVKPENKRKRRISMAKLRLNTSGSSVSQRDQRNKSIASMASIMSSEHQHANRTLTYMLIVYICCTLPFATMLIVSYVEEEENSENDFYSNNIGMLISSFIYFLSFVVNTIIYDVRSKQFRKSSRQLFKRIKNFVLFKNNDFQ